LVVSVEIRGGVPKKMGPSANICSPSLTRNLFLLLYVHMTSANSELA